MPDYVYNPQENTEYSYAPKKIEASTKLSELDTIDTAQYVNRNMDYLSKVPDDTNMFPNVLEKPLFLPVIPEGGIVGDRVEATVPVKETTSIDEKLQGQARLDALSEQENNRKNEYIKKTKLSNTTLKEFGTKIANSLLDMLNDLLSFDYNEDNFVEIFTKEDRVLSLGILLVVISLFLIIFKNTD